MDSQRPAFHRANTMAPVRTGPIHEESQRRPQSFVRKQSMRPGLERGATSRWDLETQEQPKKKKEEEEEEPPKSIVLIWLVVAGELGFDLATTIIAFKTLNEESN
eukprot:11188968-Ditylum_brightwellii.AAC.1